MQKVGIGIIGCGNISGAYLKAMASFPILDIKGVADMNAEMAKAKAEEFNVAARSVDDLLTDPEIEIIVNLTIPKAHVEVGLRALDAGKHTYSEKPLGINFAEGKRLAEAAKAKKLRIGAAPDTFLGGGHQTARTLIDQGVLGTPVGGTATFMCPGHERWHPNPAFYYEVGGGPMLDMGPYYITDLVNLFGPVAKVAGFAFSPRTERLITSEPRNGEKIPVHVATHVAGALAFQNGAIVQVGMSFDVAGHRHVPLELYGTEGTLLVPDPNHFGGEVQLLKKGASSKSRNCRRPTRMATTDRSASRTWPMLSAPIASTEPMAIWRCTFLKSWKRFKPHRTRAQPCPSPPSSTARPRWPSHSSTAGSVNNSEEE